jgi:DNA repair exonuclease SbcCD ATPase subunit/predicted MPP superfamily phosphohydrolase
MKIAHISDLHGSKEHLKEYVTSMDEFNAANAADPPDLITISGDTYDASMLNTESSGFDIVNGEIQKSGNIAPVVMVEGTPSHDVDGSLDVFKRMESKYGITVLEPGIPYFLANCRVSTSPDGAELLILGIPEPRKKYLLANGTAGKDETDEAVRNAMHLLCFQLAAIRAQYKDLPCLVVYHGDVAGTTLQNNETIERGTGIAITIDELADIGADYYALGHIHKPQQVGNLPAYYAGSIYAKNFGETHKPGWNLVELIRTVSEKSNFPDDCELWGRKMAMSKFMANVTRIDFSHPQLFHETVTLEQFDNTNWPKRIAGKIAWVAIKDKPEALIDLNPEYMANEVLVKDYGALPGSKVNLEKIAIETVRAAEIAEASTPEKKLEVWGENSAVEITEGMKAKLKTLLDTLDLSKVTIYGEWELLSVRIRGSLGIYLGIGKEEISVNFKNLNDGLVAVTGVTGKGKSSFIENCHAYPQMFTKKGKLKDQFYKRDSFREVIYRNHVDGSEKRFLIQVDGETKSGSCRYFIFDHAKGETNWIPMPGVDGNLAPYTNAVNALFGPVELFLRTAFTIQKAQKDFPDITDANENEKKELFSALAGTDYLQTIADGAFSEEKKVEAIKHDAEVKISALEGTVSGKNELADEMLRLADEKNTLADQLIQTKTSGTAAKNRVEKLQIAANAEHSRSQRAADAELYLGRIRQELAEINQSISSLSALSLRRPEIEVKIALYESLKATIEAEAEKLHAVEKRNQVKTDGYRAQMDAFNAKKGEIEKKIAAAKDELREKERGLEVGNQSKMADYQKDLDAFNQRMNSVSERNLQTQAKYQKELDSFNERKRSLENEISQARIALQKAQSDAEKILSSIKLAERDTVVFDEKCLVCKAVPVEKIESITRKREEALQCVESMQIEYADQNNAVASTEACLNELEADLSFFDEAKPTLTELEKFDEKRPEPPKPDSVPENDPTLALIESLNLELAGIGYDEPAKPAHEPFDETVLSSARAQADLIQIDDLRANLTRAAEASARIDGYKAQVIEKNRQIVEKQGELDELVRNADPDSLTDLEIAKTDLNDLTEQYRKLTADLATNQAQLEAQRKRLAEIEAQEAELAKLRDSIVTAKAESAEWDLLRRAFGPDGIQALELDALAPGIADDTNSRIKAAYGDRFKIEFRTTRIAGTGSKTKQVEDFSILVHDTEKGNVGLLENKSGGEFSEIKRALYDSFTAMRAKNANFRFLTRFLDEADGALDSASRTNYCRMLEADHESGKYRNTIIITHSDEVKAMISQKIEMEALAESAGAGKTEEAEFALEAI